MKYLVQAILNDGDINSVVDSFKTNDYNSTLDFLMRRHKNSYHYQYVVMEIATQEIIIRDSLNKYWR